MGSFFGENVLFDVIVPDLGFSGCLLSVPVQTCEASCDGQQAAVDLPESEDGRSHQHTLCYLSHIMGPFTSKACRSPSPLPPTAFFLSGVKIPSKIGVGCVI